jgi:hypothetical protein
MHQICLETITTIQQNLDITILDLAISLTCDTAVRSHCFLALGLRYTPHNDYRKDLWSGDYYFGVISF